MKLRITLLTAATLTAFSFAAHAAEKGTIMIMVNSLDNPYYASEAKGASEKRKLSATKPPCCPMAKMSKSRMSLSTPRLVKKCRALFSITLTPPPASPPLKKPKSGHSGGLN